MATTTSTKLEMSFGCVDGSSITISMSNVNPEATASSVQGLTQAIVSGGSIFDPQPVMAKAAKLVTTTSSDVDLQ